MKNIFLLLIILSAFVISCEKNVPAAVQTNANEIILPLPNLKGSMSVEEALASRRSVREYSGRQITLTELSQVLWAAQGITSEDGKRTAPSASALYPIEIYIAAGNIEGLGSGVYHYDPKRHSIILAREGSLIRELTDSTFNQEHVGKAPAVVIIAAVFERTSAVFGESSEKYVYTEAGHVAQNIYLECASLGLGTVTVGSFEAEKAKAAAGIYDESEPLYLMPIGRPK